MHYFLHRKAFIFYSSDFCKNFIKNWKFKYFNELVNTINTFMHYTIHTIDKDRINHSYLKFSPSSPDTNLFRINEIFLHFTWNLNILMMYNCIEIAPSKSKMCIFQNRKKFGNEKRSINSQETSPKKYVFCFYFGNF